MTHRREKENGFVIRSASQEDVRTLIEFNQAMAMETEGKVLPDDVISNGVKRIFDHPESGFYIVCEDLNMIVGSLMVTFEWSDWRNGYFWWIQSVYVRPEWRRRGIFRQLYSHIKQKALEQPDVCGLRLYVEKNNRNAHATYNTMGMKETDYLLFEEEFSPHN